MVRIMMIESGQQLRLKKDLENNTHFQVVAKASNLKEAILKLNDSDIDLIILDSHTTRINSKRSLIEIQQQYPNVNILIRSLERTQNLHLLESGNGSGLIFKNSAFDNYKQDLSTLDKNTISTPHPSLSKITTREWEVFKLIIKELSNQEIAEKLFISRRTVEAHKRNLLSKTNSRNLVGLILFAVQHNLIAN